MVMPCRLCDGGLVGFAGQVRLRRHFGYPGRIDPEERVWLTISALSESANIALNDQDLGSCRQQDCPWESDVTSLLRQRNDLIILLTALGETDGLWGEVALEIRRTAFLRGVEVHSAGSGSEPTFRVAGQVVGFAERPLEVYAVLGGKTVAALTVQPSEVGRDFEFAFGKETLDDLHVDTDPARRSLRLELIDGGVIWYAIERAIR
jgi:hypothetical protein